MKNKLICLILSVVMLLPVFISCTNNSKRDPKESFAPVGIDTLPAQPVETEPEPEPEEDPEPAPSVIYTVDYTDRLKRIGTAKELLTVDPSGETVYSWYVQAAIKDSIKLLCEKYEITEEEATNMLYNDALQIH